MNRKWSVAIGLSVLLGITAHGGQTQQLALAPSVGAVPGGVVLRSDEIRKRLCGVAPLDPLGPAGYIDSMSERVYRTLAERAAAIAHAGHAVIVDAVYARPDHRAALERAAAAASVPFAGIWLDAPEQTMVARVFGRHGDPSEPDADVIHRQHAQATGPISWRRLDASTPAEHVLLSARDRLKELVRDHKVGCAPA
jgi:uncharacterized protein